MLEMKITFGAKVQNFLSEGIVMRVISRIGDPIKFLKVQYKVIVSLKLVSKWNC